MTLKFFAQISLVLVLTVVSIFAVFATGRVDVQPVSQAEVDRAMGLLQESLANPRFTYIDFLRENQALRGTTPPFAESVQIDANIAYGEGLSYELHIPQRGLYGFYLTYILPDSTFSNLVISLFVNGEEQFDEASTLVLPVFWEDETKDFPLNRFGDEIMPMQLQIGGEHTVQLFDAGFTTDKPILFLLEQGTNTIEFRNTTSSELVITGFGVFSEQILPSHTPANAANAALITINSIDYTHKNSPFVQLQAWPNPVLTPFHPVDRLLNVVNMSNMGDEVFFEVDIPQSGYFPITIHSLTATDDFSTFVTIRINGEIPFDEGRSFPLEPFGDARWSNQTLVDNNGNPLLFYFQQGRNTVSLRTELAPVAYQLHQLRLLIDHINQFSLDIRRVAGREIDQNRTWRFTRYVPQTVQYLEAYDIILRDIIFALAEHTPTENHSAIANNLITGVSLLNRLRERPDDLPLFIDLLNGTDASVLQMAGISLDGLNGTVGLILNALYLGDPADLPPENSTFLQNLGAGIQHLWASYTSDKFVIRNREDALNIWVNHSYLHVDLLQQMVDAQFTPTTGIEVNLSMMPDAGRLIMARAAGTNPDAALGIPAFMPFELGARGALYDLTTFPDFWEFMGNLVPGASVGYIFNGSVFAIPETVGFWTTVYRTDILHPLGMTAPDTWQDVATMQAELQRFNMSFFKPIASGVGYKWFFQTSPLIYQNNGLLFSPDGLSTAIDQPESIEAITFLGDLFTTFALAEQVPAFFNSFRFGQTPVGIMDPGTYMLLMNAAPELLGQWDIAPFPGTEQADGSISRWFIANGVGSAIFDNTDRADEAWEFFKWYLSAEVQTEFAMALMANFNILWISSNLAALENLPIEYRHRRTILDSMEWLRDVPRSPGQYMLERRLSDIWNTMVFDGTSAQIAVDMNVLEINREFVRRMVEFGFIDQDGNQLRPYTVHELDWVLQQIEDARRLTS
ncbi:MAG: extracellular solute-binding protein [Defluviitaleaceae bacterium]|nr:extracellular solute-binding protein [Defluviitaleaceae bacterium]